MPHKILKKVWDYCSYSKKYLLLIFILLLVSEVIQEIIQSRVDDYLWFICQAIVFLIINGYGMEIARDRINNGVRLPKINVKNILFSGFKVVVVMGVYASVQTFILHLFSSPLNFPTFDLEDMLLNWTETIHMLFTHSFNDAVIFLVFGLILFYITTFFVEIAIARLADSRSILHAFNLVEIKRDIDAIGWRNYAVEYTLIILTIVILTYLQSYNVHINIIDNAVNIFLGFIIFATQYLGIGAVYSRIKQSRQKKQRINIE